MSRSPKVTDSSQWVAELNALSSTTSRIAPPGSIPLVPYWDAVNGAVLEPEAFSFANDSDHHHAFARCFDELSRQGAADKTLLNYLRALTSGKKTYGTASELLAYLWLLDHNVSFDIQVPMTGTDILNPNGSDLDGKLTVAADVFFDIKAFGFQERLVKRLTDRLEADLPGKWVAVEGSWDVPVETLEELLGYRPYQKLLDDLKKKMVASRGVLQFVMRDKQSVQTSHRISDPYQFAQKNSSYAFNYAKQFCRNHPFLLIFAHHPWLGGQSFATNFSESASTTCRALARRSFIQFLRDESPVYTVTMAEASKLLSGIAFLNISKPPDAGKKDKLLRIYLNPNATHPIPDLVVDYLGHHDPTGVEVDRFLFDNY